jgi:hypothetical protein
MERNRLMIRGQGGKNVGFEGSGGRRENCCGLETNLDVQ